MINDPIPPGHATVRNNGGFLPPTEFVLTLPAARATTANRTRYEK